MTFTGIPNVNLDIISVG